MFFTHVAWKFGIFYHWCKTGMWRTPKLLDGLNFESKSENNARKKNWVRSLVRSTSGVKGRAKAPKWD
jgi:hypothetical protein